MSRSRELAELATAYDSGGSFGFRNRIINGQMMIDQRNAGAAVTASGAYPVDRFVITNSATGTFSAQQDASTPVGFNKSVKITVTAAQTAGTGNLSISQSIEGYNIADLGWGSANAQAVTLSFWVRSSLTGTFGGAFRNEAATRSYPFSYTINSADTWEQKTVVVAGDTTGTWVADNGTGLSLRFSLFAATSSQQTAGVWYAGSATGATGQTQLASTLNATWYITGVQLEKGSTATSFDYRPYGTELALCQRYYYQHFAGGSSVDLGMAWAASSTEARYAMQLPVTMRASPTLVSNTGTNYYDFYLNGVDRNTSSLALASVTPNTAIIGGTISGATAYQIGVLYINTNARIGFSSEL